MNSGKSSYNKTFTNSLTPHNKPHMNIYDKRDHSTELQNYIVIKKKGIPKQKILNKIVNFRKTSMISKDKDVKNKESLREEQMIYSFGQVQLEKNKCKNTIEPIKPNKNLVLKSDLMNNSNDQRKILKIIKQNDNIITEKINALSSNKTPKPNIIKDFLIKRSSNSIKKTNN